MPDIITPDTALFLDIDGTLLDIAEKPDLVVIPDCLPALLVQLRDRLGGALAVISGRPLNEIDRFFPINLVAAAEHGAMIRDGNGKLHNVTSRPAAYAQWLTALQNAARDMPGIIIEEKAVGIVAHYRQAPQYGAALEQLTADLAAQAGPETIVMRAHMAFELRPRGASKDASLTWFMRQTPFAGRKPVFIGDDTTDEPAIELATKLGGTGLHVARDFGGAPQAVRAWLKTVDYPKT